jgi:hypothetical protein
MNNLHGGVNCRRLFMPRLESVLDPTVNVPCEEPLGYTPQRGCVDAKAKARVRVAI